MHTHLTQHMTTSPLNELVEAKHAASWAIRCVQGIIKHFVVDGTAGSITTTRGATPEGEGGQQLLQGMDQTVRH